MLIHRPSNGSLINGDFNERFYYQTFVDFDRIGPQIRFSFGGNNATGGGATGRMRIRVGGTVGTTPGGTVGTDGDAVIDQLFEAVGLFTISVVVANTWTGILPVKVCMSHNSLSNQKNMQRPTTYIVAVE